MLKPIKNIAIFASGAGSNAEKIIQYFNKKQTAAIKLIVCNKPDAGVLKVAKNYGILTLLIEKEKFLKGDAYVDELKAAEIDFIVLAGFLWKIPLLLIDSFPNKIINIHPALLPKYGGKGMYGMHVHEAVVNNKEVETGITIHYVDGQYDHGDIIFQAKCEVLASDSPTDVAQKIHSLEHAHFPAVIEKVIESLGQ
jgi:phosphoribosylglycinamide formyltransferase-1